jgi:hypothetical protein
VKTTTTPKRIKAKEPVARRPTKEEGRRDLQRRSGRKTPEENTISNRRF